MPFEEKQKAGIASQQHMHKQQEYTSRLSLGGFYQPKPR